MRSHAGAWERENGSDASAWEREKLEIARFLKKLAVSHIESNTLKFMVRHLGTSMK